MNAILFYVTPTFRLTGSTINAIEYFLAAYEHNPDIKLLLLNKDKSVKVRLNKSEFFKFLSLISAFKDVLIGEDSITSEDNLEMVNNHSQKINDYLEINDDIYQIDSEPTDESLKNNDTEELNPEEWDPW